MSERVRQDIKKGKRRVRELWAGLGRGRVSEWSLKGERGRDKRGGAGSM